MNVILWSKYYALAATAQELAIIFNSRKEWLSEAELSDSSAPLVERHATRLSSLLEFIRKSSPEIPAHDPDVHELHIVAVRTRYSLHKLFPVIFGSECGSEWLGSAGHLVEEIEKAIGPEIESIDRIWPMLFAKADSYLLNRTVEPPKTDLARRAIAIVGDTATHKKIREAIQDMNEGISLKDLQPCLDYLRTTGEYNGKTRATSKDVLNPYFLLFPYFQITPKHWVFPVFFYVLISCYFYISKAKYSHLHYADIERIISASGAKNLIVLV